MVFSSLIFTFIFLPLVIIGYYIVRGKARNYFLLIASLLFYAYGEPKFVFVMLLSIGVNYLLAMLIDKEKLKDNQSLAKTYLVTDIVLNIGILFVFKYLNFSCRILNTFVSSEIPVTNIALPIGISFFTFQALSYVVDVYRGTVRVQKNPLFVALYISFFPQLIAGPIVRYSTIEEQIEQRSCTLLKFSEGIRRFFLGFSKKILLANTLAVIAQDVFAADYTLLSPLTLWLGAVCFSLQIFYDFSAYSDMAIGLGKMFGFDFLENFNYPYISKNSTEFWRRWHISLGAWFRDYVYVPMGGSKVSVPKHIRNLFVMWLLTGLWHGANYTYIGWGMMFFFILIIEKYFVKPTKRESRVFLVLWQLFTLIYVIFTMVVFNAPSILRGVEYCKGMLFMYIHSIHPDIMFVRYIREYWFFIIAGILYATPIARVISERFDKNEALGRLKAICFPIGYGLIFLWAVSFLILGAHNPFIYFNF